jgi:hypothetical protein
VSCGQIENPCALLDQENAKNFIGGSSQDKYKFFLRVRAWPLPSFLSPPAVA